MNSEAFSLKRVGLQTSLVCNLNCKICGAYAPYTLKKRFPTLTEVAEWTGGFFNIVDYVEIFSITGGEPLLYKQLPEYFEKLTDFNNKIGHVEIYTNGTIVPSSDLVKSIKGYNKKVIFKVDNYGAGISKKISEISSLLDSEGLDYSIRDYFSESMHCGGWVDYGDPVKAIHTKEEAEELFKKCIQPNVLKYCFTIFENCLFPCSQVCRRMNLEQSVDYGDYIDFTDTNLSAEQQRQKISNMYIKCLETCAYCNGMCDDSPRYKPAEQLTDAEIRKIRQSAKII